MKYAYVLAASAALVSAHKSCSCTTWVETIYGEPTGIPAPPKRVEVTTPTPQPQPAPEPSPEPSPEPTPSPSSPQIVTVIPQPGTYTFEPTTVVVPDGEPTTISVTPVGGGEASTTVLPPGTYTAPATTVTVTDTNYVYVCPLTDIASPAPEPTPEEPAPEAPIPEEPTPEEPAPEAPIPEEPTPEESAPEETPAPEVPASEEPAPEAPTPEKPAPQKLAPEKPAPEEPAQEEEPKPTPKPKPTQKKQRPPVAKPPSITEGNRPNGSRWAMTYTPYTQDGMCKDAAQVMKDLAEVKRKGFTTVRLYGTDCFGLESVGEGCAANDLHMIAGVFIGDGGIDASREQVQDIAQWKRWDLVDMIVVGNEAIFKGLASPQDLASFISEARDEFRNAGFQGPITTAETVKSLTDNGETLCPVIDVVGANIHPFFNPDLPAEEAGAFVADELERISNVCGNTKPAYNLECGWPHDGTDNAQALANKEAQRKALQAIEDVVGDKVVFFSFSDDYWKSSDPVSIERFFGSLDVF